VSPKTVGETPEAVSLLRAASKLIPDQPGPELGDLHPQHAFSSRLQDIQVIVTKGMLSDFDGKEQIGNYQLVIYGFLAMFGLSN
jgi:hypothetical protein